jgi:hypothetical protein
MFRWVICHFRHRNIRCRLSYTLLQPRYRRRTGTLPNVCRLPENICSTFVLLTSYLSLFCITLSTIVFLLIYYLLFTSNADYPFGIANLYFSITYPSDIGDLGRFWLSCLVPLVLLLPNILVIDFPIFPYWPYLMKVIPETRHVY